MGEVASLDLKEILAYYEVTLIVYEQKAGLGKLGHVA